MTGVFYLLSQALAVLAVAMLLPAGIASVEGKYETVEAFLLTAILTGFGAGAAILALRDLPRQLRRTTGLTFMAALWIAIPLVAAIPIMAAENISFLSALFEAASGFTTTGATIFPSLGGVSRALLFWRAELQWLGGLATLVTVLMVIAPAGIGGLSNPNIGLVGTGITHGLNRSLFTGRPIAAAYIAATIICLGALVLCGIPAFDALCLTLSTISTGGFMPRDGTLAVYQRPAAEAVLTLFMLAGATSIVWHHMIFRWRWTLISSHRESYWLVGATILLGFAYASAFTHRSGTPEPIFAAMGNGLFTGASLISTTGYQPSLGDIAALPAAVIAFVAVVGGGGLSTSGGLKFFRIGAMFVQSIHELQRLAYPHRVRPTQFGSQTYDIDLMKTIWASAICCLATISVAAVVLSIDLPNLESAALAAISGFSNIGPLYPAYGEINPGWPAYADFTISSRLAMIATMIAGRLEIIAFISLLSVAYWRR